MTLVLEAHVFDGYTARAEGSHDLLGFTNGHARVICAVHDEERRGNTIYIMDGRNLLQEFAVVIQAAILRFAHPAPPGTGILKERHEIGDTNDIYGSRPEIRIGGDGREYHETTVAATHHRDTFWIGDAAFTQPEYGVLQVGYRVHAQAHIVQALVLIAIAGAAAHIRCEHGVTLRHEVLNHGTKRRADLALGATMHIDNNSHTRTVTSQRQVFRVPGVFTEIGHFGSGEIEPGQREKLAPAITEQVESAPICRPGRKLI